MNNSNILCKIKIFNYLHFRAAVKSAYVDIALTIFLDEKKCFSWLDQCQQPARMRLRLSGVF
jgi:hypothetical protein